MVGTLLVNITSRNCFNIIQVSPDVLNRRRSGPSEWWKAGADALPHDDASAGKSKTDTGKQTQIKKGSRRSKIDVDPVDVAVAPKKGGRAPKKDTIQKEVGGAAASKQAKQAKPWSKKTTTAPVQTSFEPSRKPAKATEDATRKRKQKAPDSMWLPSSS